MFLPCAEVFFIAATTHCSLLSNRFDTGPRLHFFLKIAMLIRAAANWLTEHEDLFHFSMPRSGSSIFCVFFLLFFGVCGVSADDISKISPVGYVRSEEHTSELQ